MVKMKLDEMRELIEKASDHKVSIKYVPDKELSPFAGIAQTAKDGSKTISITRGLHKSLSGKPVSKAFIRAFILHELGHLHTIEDQAAHKNEYNAHLWAIKRAQKLGYKKVVGTLREEIIDWQNLDKTKDYIKYREASDLYLKEQGFII